MQYAKNINYLTAIGHAHPQMRTVVHGDYEEIFALMATDMEYPLFWVETPDIATRGDADHIEQQINNAFVIGTQCHPNSKPAELAAKDITHTYIMQCIRRIISDSQAGDIHLDASAIQIDPVNLGADRMIGWRVELPTIKQVCETDEGFARIQHPAFTWDGTTVSEVENTTLDTYDRALTFTVGGAYIDMADIANITIDPLDANTYIYVALTYTGKHHELCASMIITGTDPQNSIPYLYNPYIHG